MTVPDKQRVSPRMARKARARHEQGKVHYRPHARTYVVEGDTTGALYKVTVERNPDNGPDDISCDCPANGACWHIQAVRIARRTEEESAHVLPRVPWRQQEATP